jgi:hypothetical protein
LLLVALTIVVLLHSVSLLDLVVTSPSFVIVATTVVLGFVDNDVANFVMKSIILSR